MSYPFRLGSRLPGPVRRPSSAEVRLLAVGLLAAGLSAFAPAAYAPSAWGQQSLDLLEEFENGDDDAGGEANPPVAEPDAGPGRYDYRGKDGEADSVDARFPQDPERVRQLKAIGRAVETGDWDRASDALLFILGEAEGEVVRLSNGRSATVVDEARRLFDQFPAAERRALERRLGGAARLALDEALAAGDAAMVRDVAVRFPATDAARDARVRLALLHLDRGEAGLAAKRFAWLLGNPEDGAYLLNDPRRRAAVIAAFARGGEPEMAAALWAATPPAALASLNLPPAAAGGVPAALAGAEVEGAAVLPSRIDDPLLVPRWSTPIVADPAEREDFREAVDRLQRSGLALLPVWEPLTVTVNGRDLALSRTTAGVMAVDAVTGEVKWRSRDSGLAVQGATQQVMSYQRMRSQTEAERNDTVSAVYREAAFGTLTTDGVRVFLLEADDDPAGPSMFLGGRSTGALGRPVRLVAYRLDTGRLDWEIGGTLRDEPFDLPLAGWRPLAAPTVDGGDLFVVAERVAADGLRQIDLFCLDPITGQTRWNRNVATAEASINEDPVRAEWGAWCAVERGVIVVPTTVGWVAGVDRLTREVLWVERVYEPQVSGVQGFRGLQGGPNVATADPEALADYWRPGPPRVLGRRLIVAPPGEDRLYGLDLLTGERLWRPRYRRNWKAVAALLPGSVFAGNKALGKLPADEGALVLVGPASLAAVSLKDGSTRIWTYSLPKELGRPSGMPLVAGARLLVPVSGGALITLNAATGERVEVSRRTDAGGPGRGLGALGVSGGRLLSVGPSGFVGFEDRAGLTADLAAAADSGEPAGPLLTLREAELLRTARKTTEVLAKLDAIRDGAPADAAPPGLSSADAERYRALLRSTLRDAILGVPGEPPPEPDRQDELLDRMTELADTPARLIAAERLRADRLRDRGEPAKAVAALRTLVADRLRAGAAPDANPLVPAAEGDAPPPPAAEPDAAAPDAEVRLSRDVSRELRLIWEAGGAEAATAPDVAGRKAVDALAEEWLAEAPEGLPPHAPAAELLPFHPAIAAATAAWAEAALASPDAATPTGGAAAAELLLYRLADGRDDAVAERAEELLKSLGESGEESAGDNAASGAVVEALAGDLQARPPAALPAPATVRPYFRTHTLVASDDGTRLDVWDVGTPDAAPAVSARFPLLGDTPYSTARQIFQRRGQEAIFSSYIAGRATARPAVAATGGVIFAVTRGAVAAIHPQSGATLWSRPVEGAAPAAPGDLALGVPADAEGGPRTLQRAARWARTTSRRPLSGVVAANAEVVVVLEDRTLTVLDALTGETIWIRRRLDPQNAMAAATSTAVIVTPRSSSSEGGLALTAREGAPLEAADRALNVAARALAIAGAGLVHVVEGPAGGYFFTSWDPGNDRPLWIRGVDSEAKMIVLPEPGPPVAVIVTPDDGDDDAEDDGLLVDLRTGAATVLGGVNTGGASLAALADPDRVMLVARPTRGSSRQYTIDELPTTTVGGTLDVFARSGGRLWRTNAAGAELLHDGIDRAGFVTLLTAAQDAERGQLTEVEVVALHKQTGRELLRTVVPVLERFEQSAVTPAGDALHLWNTNTRAQEYWRVRLTPGEAAAENAAPPAEGDEVSAAEPDAAPAEILPGAAARMAAQRQEVDRTEQRREAMERFQAHGEGAARLRAVRDAFDREALQREREAFRPR
ncbi:outer membrane protein assembly factor BamB family protein [Alienimonas californiensis]|uniref:Outer membrane biogenesis protein BamB n=1 Tax=Alienimonas californiensis TaxID=2527989 RepID=A0A517PF60_9PLAN|nr:PQQ-binding-like beta-propeller repeat protein [Alienimonas californiensis]QDT18011.1 outer membrane biogenesis protein BamB [Alienimonas californiensis]